MPKIKLSVDVEKESLIFTSIIYFASYGMPDVLQTYVDQRKNSTFQPYHTSFQRDSQSVYLIQRVPFSAPCSTRMQLLQFWHLAERCRHLLLEIDREERLSLLSLER